MTDLTLQIDQTPTDIKDVEQNKPLYAPLRQALVALEKYKNEISLTTPKFHVVGSYILGLKVIEAMNCIATLADLQKTIFVSRQDINVAIGKANVALKELKAVHDNLLFFNKELGAEVAKT